MIVDLSGGDVPRENARQQPAYNRDRRLIAHLSDIYSGVAPKVPMKDGLKLCCWDIETRLTGESEGLTAVSSAVLAVQHPASFRNRKNPILPCGACPSRISHDP